jgi:hypothetical protein
MEGCDYWHSEFAQEGQNMTACGSSEYAEFIVETHDIDIADIQEVGRFVPTSGDAVDPGALQLTVVTNESKRLA